MPPPGLVHLLWHDRVLRFAFLVAGMLITYQLVVTLLHPVWISLVTDWFRAALSWPQLALVVLISLWLTRAHRPEAHSWWLISKAGLLVARRKHWWRHPTKPGEEHDRKS